jgi:hypothetical protein
VQHGDPGLEVQVDLGQPRDRIRAHVPHAHHAVEQVVLERNRDVLLDLGARQAERLGLDLEHGT